jgi:hypothetical protein
MALLFQYHFINLVEGDGKELGIADFGLRIAEWVEKLKTES